MCVLFQVCVATQWGFQDCPHSGSTEHWNSFWNPGSRPLTNSENCALLCKTSEMEQGSGLTPFIKIYLLKCRLWWMFLLGGCCLAYPACTETCLDCENKCRVGIDESWCTWWVNCCITFKKWQDSIGLHVYCIKKTM